MEKFDDLKNKSHKWREWYYDGEPDLPPVAEPVKEAFELINATLFGHIYQRPQLSTKIRSLCTIAALTVLDKPKQLPGHITGALNSGASKEEIIELINDLVMDYVADNEVEIFGELEDLGVITNEDYLKD